MLLSGRCAPIGIFFIRAQPNSLSLSVSESVTWFFGVLEWLGVVVALFFPDVLSWSACFDGPAGSNDGSGR